MNKITLIALIAGLYMSFFQYQRGGEQVEKAFDTFVNDSIPVQINLHYNRDNLPEQYVSHVETPVCKEGLCYQMVIDLYWDLLGNFLKYELPEDQPLTKFDHMEFTEEDHGKMIEILSNKDSFLRFYALENLIDTTEQRASNVTDGITGATHKSIQSDVVGGAVYSTYVLWHIVNGPIAGKVLKYTEDRFDDSLMVQLLESNNYHYQYYALNRITEEEREKYLPYIIRLISEGIAFVPYFAIEKIPLEVWESPDHQAPMVGLIKGLDFEMQNELLNRIKNVSLSEDALDGIVSSLEVLRESQMVKALDILSENINSVSKASLSRILPITKHPNKEIAALASKIMEGREDFQEP